MSWEIVALMAGLLAPMNPAAPASVQAPSGNQFAPGAGGTPNAPDLPPNGENEQPFVHPDGKDVFTIIPGTRRQVDVDIQEIGFRIEGGPNDPTSSAATMGRAQINCRTRKRRTVSHDPAPASQKPGEQVRADDPWIDLSEDAEDRLLFASACGEGAGPSPRREPLPDYPVLALVEGREGRAEFRITVAPSGAVTDCRIVTSSGHSDLDAATCVYAHKLKKAEGVYQGVVSWHVSD